LLTIRRYPNDDPPKTDRSWLRQCIKIAEVRNDLGTIPCGSKHTAGGRTPTMAVGRTAGRTLFRRRGNQGAPYKCPVLREKLWDWFVDMRRSIASTISPKFVLLKAKSMATEVLAVQRRTGNYTPMPKLDKHWLLRWKRDHGVVFRKPNLRFKASKAVMTLRLRAMWANTFRVRQLARRLLGHDLDNQFYGIDEKPLHFNEGGSKCIRTLEIAGCPAVRLKQNHAATRERVSVMTMTTSNLAAIERLGGLPVPSQHFWLL
jgi:hypothetical protein